ncbi:MAG: hypothetical protein M1818_005818 [Claussenomyces sp. TS43310]|nr:MAG: hypothetical protein M1818_005818 [Claussenomyces sp. TS43310]
MPLFRPSLRHLTGRQAVVRSRNFATAADPQGLRASGHTNRVKIVEVGPRDGLQNEKKTISLETKLEFIRRLARTGLKDIEAGSFVAPKWTPQMANSNEVLEYILNHPPSSPHPISYSFLAPNMKGLDNAMAILNKSGHFPSRGSAPPTPPASPSEEDSPAMNTSSHDPNLKFGTQQESAPDRPKVSFSVFPAATETFTQKNLNCDIATSLQRFKPVIQGAKSAGLHVRAYISVVLGCPFEGYDVDPHKVAEMATDLMEMGADEIDLGDTTGMGTAPRTAELLRTMTAAGVRNEDITMHFHDTYGQALVNTAISLEHGIRTFDSSVGGLGGCPYSPGATGNVATEDMVYFLESLGMDTGVDLDAIADIGSWITTEIEKPNASSVGRAIRGKRSSV